MRLETVRVKNFRSILDSNNIHLEDITALIGPNQAGKSSILQGLASLSMDESYGDFDLTQLDGVAKKVTDHELLPENIEIVWGNFLLTSDDLNALDSIFVNPKIDSPKPTNAEGSQERSLPTETVHETEENRVNITLTKSYDEFYRLNFKDHEVRFPSRAKLQSGQEEIESLIDSLSSKAEQDDLRRNPNTQFKTNFDEAIKSASKVSGYVIADQKSEAAIQKLEEVISLGFDENFKKDIRSTVNQVRKKIDAIYPKDPIELAAYNFVIERMPRLVFFKTYERMEDDVLLSELKKKPREHKVFLNFLKLAEIKLDILEEIVETQNPIQIHVYLETGCGKATRLIRKAWPQEVLDVELRYLDGRLSVFTKNSKLIESLLPPSSGSEGFQWYFGFYTNFGAATKAEYKNAILLLDDPGVYLHPSGQKSLVELFEKYLEDNVTTIYSTHLPFLVPRQRLHRMRLIEKSEEGRSQVSEKFWHISDKDVLYPLRAALGVDLADSLYAGARTLIAEGPSDRILLHGMLREFSKRGLRPIQDLDNIEVLSGKGATRAKDHAILLQIERLSYVVVLDNDDEGRKAKEDAVNDGLPDDRIVLLGHYHSQKKDYDIEDMFPLEIYAKAFCAVHGQAIKLAEDEILKRLNDEEEKASNRAKKILRGSAYELDKPGVAREIMRILSVQKDIDKTLIERFEELFDEIDHRIPLYEK